VLWASDPGGTFTSVSPQIEAALGYAPQDLLGHSLTELTNPENRGEFQLEFNRCLEAQTPSRIAPCFLQHKNGKTLAWEISLEPCFNPAGLCLGFKGSAQDMTAQLLAEKSQEEKEACFQSLQKILLETDERQKNMLASGHDILWVTDAQGKFTAISPQIEPLFGYPPDELIGLTPVNFFEMQNYEKFKDADLESMLLKPAVMETMLVTMHHRDGQELIIEINAEPVWGVPETFLGYRGCCRDVTEQKRAEFALEESEARFHNIFSSSPSALCLADPQGQVAEVNRSMCELFGALAEADIKGLSLFEYLPLSDENQHDLRAHRIIRFEGAYDPTMLRNRRAFTPQQTGSLHLEVLVSLVPWQNTDSEGYLVQIQDVTDRKIAEDALCQSEEKYRTIFENCGTALIIINEDLSLTLINREMENLTGYTSRELLDLNPWLKIVATADLEKIQAFHVQRRIDPDSVPRSYEICFCHKNGEKRIALLSATLIPSTRQSLAALVDITERKQIEEALRLSEEKYRATFENSGNALALIEDDLSISLANPELEVLLGVSRSELEGRKKWPDFLANGEELNKFNRYREQLLRDPGDLPKSCECILRHQNGSLRDVMAAMTYLPASHQFLITFIDITERKAAEKKLLESEKRYRLLADNIHDVIWMADADRRLTFVTPSITRLRGFSVEEVLGQKIEQAFTPESVQRMKDWDTSEKPKSAKQTWGQSLELEQICRDGSTVWTEVHISPMLDSAGRLQGYVGMSRDISARRQAEFEQRRLEEQLRQSQKMEIIGHLAGGIAHDFNNLLTPILGYADMAASQVPAGNPLANDIKAIQETAERAARLTRQLLAFSLKQVLHMSTVQLNREIMDFIKMLHSLIGEHILVRTELAPDLGCIKADITQVQQVLMNLAVNARDAMPRGGSLTFSTANVLVDEALIKRHPALNAGAHVRLTVTDTGTGIAPEILAHIFEPFFTTKERGKGTGLGLSMVYGIVTQHQGAVVAESEPGKGSALHVYFPWVEATPALAEDHAAVEENGGGHETILVVEDEPMVRKLALEFLSGQGYTVLEASDPLQALEFLRSYAGNFDLLLTDIIMPGMNGKELFEHLAQERPKLKVLYMSGYSEDVIAHQGVLDAGTELLSKPFALKALLTKVRSVLDQPAAT
jgi:PAS domain S-box-containing protein